MRMRSICRKKSRNTKLINIEASKAEYEKPFASEEELKEKLARQCELNAQLDHENAKVTDADIGGMEESKEQSFQVAENRSNYGVAEPGNSYWTDYGKKSR